MGKMMKTLFGAGAALALLLSTQTVSADQCCQPVCDPCMDWCDMCGDWEVGAHALVFTPVACEYDYAIIPAQTDVAAEVFSAKCQLDWGFRIFGVYSSGCSFAGLSYQWFESKVKTSAERDTNAFLMRFGNTAAKASACMRLEYQNVDVRAGRYLHKNCGSNFYVFGNARWVDLSFSRSTRGVITPAGNTIEAKEKSTLEGGALGVGMGAEMDLWCDVGLFGEANILGVIADRATKDVGIDRSATANSSTRYGSQTCINPEANFKIGLNYTYTCGCWTFVGEIGYELDYFWNAFAFAGRNEDDGNVEDRVRSCEDVGFSGLFFGGRILF